MASDGSIKITTDLDTSAAQKAMKTFGKIASTGLKGTVTAVTAVSGAISAVGGYAIKTGAEFESAMSRVQAISGATGKEFDALKQQAMELGASTAFSASEAAEGMENLASAGFNTNEIIAAMPGMLDLAASSGEDLASSADIAASTLRGFGLEAEQAGHVADVLAKNAADTNAAVADTGEAMKYAAPVAHNFGISMEECAAAIGIMFDAGIKGGQAGTSLRGALSRLAKPTDDMKEIMNKLGLEFFDSNGKMISLTEQTKMLSEKMSNLTDEERNNALVTLYGQESLSGMLALVQAGSNKIASLTESYKNCDGAAAEMAKTMQDNLKASLEQVGGAAETFGIKVYESMSDDLKSAADTASESINQITDAFENGGLKGAVEEAGDVFAELSVDVANQAPKMVDSAVTFIQAFVGGIYDNRKQLISSAGVVASTITEGLAELLPASVRKPVKNAIDEIEESFSNGGLKDAVKTVSTTIENFGKGVSSVAKVALPPFTKGVDLLGRNLETVIPIATAFTVAVKGKDAYKTAGKEIEKLTGSIKSVSGWYKKAKTALATYTIQQEAAKYTGRAYTVELTAGQAVLGVFTGKVKVATAAQKVWNTVMNANPMGILLTAVSALAAGIGVYALMADKSKDSTVKLTEEQRKNIEQAHKNAEAYAEMDKQRQESMASVQAEYGHYSELNEELKGLIDSSGKVKEGYEERANFIVNELSSALGMEKDKIWEIVKSNEELGDSIDKLIEKKKAEAILTANEEAYKTAVKKRNKILSDYQKSLKDLSETEKTYGETKKKADEAMELYYELLKSSPEAAKDHLDACDSIIRKNEEAKESYEKAKKAVEEDESTYVGYVTTIKNYEGLSAAILSNDAAAIEIAMQNIQNSFITAETGTRASLEKQVENMETHYEELKQAVEDGTPGVTQEMVDQANEMVSRAKDELKRASESALPEISTALGNLGITVTQSMIDALSSKTPDVRTKTLEMLNQISEGKVLKEGEIKALLANLGIDSVDSLIGAISGKEPAVQAEGIQLLSELQNAEGQKREEIISALRKLGIDSGDGLAKSLSSKKSDVNMSANEVISEPEKVADSYNLGYRGAVLGSDFGTGYANGILGTVSAVSTAAQKIVNAALEKTRQTQNSNSPAKESMYLGEDYGDGYALGIDNKKDFVGKTSAQLTDTALKSLNLDELHEKMKGIDIPSTMQEVYSVVNQKQLNVSEKIISEIEGKLNVSQRREQMQVKMSDDDLAKIGREFAKSSSGLIVDALVKSDLKMEMYGERVGRLTTETIDNRLAVANMKARRRTI